MTFDEEMRDLVDRGLIVIERDEHGEERVRLTERGHQVALAQKGEQPKDASLSRSRHR